MNLFSLYAQTANNISLSLSLSMQSYLHEIHKHIIESVHHRHAQVVLLSNWIQDSVPAKHSVVLKVKASGNT